ncbi:helix-turn-helix transcriptional regulator [Dactylosporangium sp. NPDC051541]|uniref:helix-turn-helix transcriptional regulator n=1 Tax=Dactylosporangium sp. NPDC051541 TaxID=3363977 RepID=UPI0037BAAC20
MSQVFEATTIERAEQVLRDNYGGSIRLDGGGSPARLRLEAAQVTPAVRLDQISIGFGFGLRTGPLGVLVICHIHAGQVGYRAPAGERIYGAGDVFIPVEPDQPYAARCRDTDFCTAVLDPDLPGQLAGPAPGRKEQPVRFRSHEPLSREAAQNWDDTYTYVRDALAGLRGADYPLITGSAARLLVAAALTAFPNDAVHEPTIEDRRDAHPATLRRAVAYIDDNAHRDITVADIAAAAYVTIRTIQHAFRRHLGTTPTAHLRRVRLEHAHRDLRAAVPATGTSISASTITVAGIARHWGFADQTRFTAAYRAAFGQPPHLGM